MITRYGHEIIKLPHHQGSYLDAGAEPACGKLSLFLAVMQLGLHQESGRQDIVTIYGKSIKIDEKPNSMGIEITSQIHPKTSAPS